MKNVVLALLLAGVAGAAYANTEEHCKAAHAEAVKAGNHDLAAKIEADMKAGKFDECVKLEAAK